MLGIETKWTEWASHTSQLLDGPAHSTMIGRSGQDGMRGPVLFEVTAGFCHDETLEYDYYDHNYASSNNQ